MNRGWVAKSIVQESSTTLDGPTQNWFTPVIFVPLVELADYTDKESLDPVGAVSKQDRCRVLKMVGDVNFVGQPRPNESEFTCNLSFYFAVFGQEEVQNAALVGPTGVVNYDPLDSDGRFLFRQQRIIEQRHVVGDGAPNVFSTENGIGWPSNRWLRNFHYNKRLGVTLTTDEELYLVYAASFDAIGEDGPTLSLSLMLRMLVTD